MKYHLAIDIGASSGRHILGWLEDGKYRMEEVYRFPNGAVNRNGHLCWKLEDLYGHVLAGIQKCGELNKIPETIGIDTWALDYVLLNDAGTPIAPTYAYRDKRTDGMEAAVSDDIPDEILYAENGIQKMAINTIYQLKAHLLERPDDFSVAKAFLMIPDYLNYRLTGIMANEYTNATTTGLVDARSCDWNRKMIRTLGLPESIFLPIRLPGTLLGGLSEEVKRTVGFDSKVVLPATHDTGSAFLAVPSGESDTITLSSGTWSLMGTENSKPMTDESCRTENFTNEGGYEKRYRFLKNIMGLWIIQSIRHELNDSLSFPELEQAARSCSEFPSRIPANAPRFLSPASMISEIQSACRETKQQIPQSPGELMQCAYASLANCYKETADSLSAVTGKQYTAVHIVGGGSRDSYLNQLTANAVGLPVIAGPTEGTALGNLMVQFLYSKEFPDLFAARKAIRSSFELKEYFAK